MVLHNRALVPKPQPSDPQRFRVHQVPSLFRRHLLQLHCQLSGLLSGFEQLTLSHCEVLLQSLDLLEELVLSLLRSSLRQLALALHGSHEHALLRLQVIDASPQLSVYLSWFFRAASNKRLVSAISMPRLVPITPNQLHVHSSRAFPAEEKMLITSSPRPSRKCSSSLNSTWILSRCSRKMRVRSCAFHGGFASIPSCQR